MKNNIRTVRKSQKLTQDKLAEICDLDINTIRNTERGRSIPSIITIVKISEALGVSIDDLYSKMSL